MTFIYYVSTNRAASSNSDCNCCRSVFDAPASTALQIVQFPVHKFHYTTRDRESGDDELSARVNVAVTFAAHTPAIIPVDIAR